MYLSGVARYFSVLVVLVCAVSHTEGYMQECKRGFYIIEKIKFWRITPNCIICQ